MIFQRFFNKFSVIKLHKIKKKWYNIILYARTNGRTQESKGGALCIFIWDRISLSRYARSSVFSIWIPPRPLGGHSSFCSECNRRTESSSYAMTYPVRRFYVLELPGKSCIYRRCRQKSCRNVRKKIMLYSGGGSPMGAPNCSPYVAPYGRIISPVFTYSVFPVSCLSEFAFPDFFFLLPFFCPMEAP